MNDTLDRLARELRLDDAAHERLRLVFGHDCVERVRHLLEDQHAVDALDGLAAYLDGRLDRARFDGLAEEAARLAGRAREAADYAAYATVYAQGGSAAVVERESFATEFAWQAEHLATLARASLSTT